MCAGGAFSLFLERMLRKKLKIMEAPLRSIIESE
jgi:hypothetical protein